MGYIAQAAAAVKVDDDSHAQGEASSVAFGMVPDAWARDPRVSAECLCLQAYRTTFARERGAHGLWHDKLAKDGVLRPGLGRNVFERANRLAAQLGMLDRPHNSTLPRGARHRFKRPVDRVILPADAGERSRIAYRAWFSELGLKEMACLLFVRSWPGRGVYRREVEERFGWSKPTALKALSTLARRGILKSLDHRDKGRITGTTYTCAKLGAELPDAIETTPKNSGRGATVKKPGHGQPGHGNPGHIRNAPPDGDSSLATLAKTPTQDAHGMARAARCASGREAPFAPVEAASASQAGSPANGVGAGGEGQKARQGGAGGDVGRPTFGGGTRRQVRPADPERVVLANWRTSYEQAFERMFFDDAAEIMTLESWRYQLDLYGGAPRHMYGPLAYRHATEIAQELAARSEEVDAPVPLDHAMLAVAAEICTAHAAGSEFRSLGFIAVRLAYRIRQDSAWALNLPRRTSVSDAEFDAASALAVEVLKAVRSFTYGISVDEELLLATYEVECLAEALTRYGRDSIVAAVNYVTRNKMWANGCVDEWRYFVGQIEPARAAQHTASLLRAAEEVERRQAAEAAREAKERETAALDASAAAVYRQYQPHLIGEGGGRPRPTAAYDREAEIVRAVEWVSGYLGSAWHQRVRLTWDARRAGIDDRALRDALIRLGCQRGRGVTGKQRRVAMPGVAPEEAVAA